MWCDHCGVNPKKKRGKFCSRCYEYRRCNGTFPPDDLILKELEGRWARAHGAPRSKSVTDVPIGSPQVVATYVDNQRHPVHKRVTSDRYTYDNY